MSIAVILKLGMNVGNKSLVFCLLVYDLKFLTLVITIRKSFMPAEIFILLFQSFILLLFYVPDTLVPFPVVVLLHEIIRVVTGF